MTEREIALTGFTIDSLSDREVQIFSKHLQSTFGVYAIARVMKNEFAGAKLREDSPQARYGLNQLEFLSWASTLGHKSSKVKEIWRDLDRESRWRYTLPIAEEKVAEVEKMLESRIQFIFDRRDVTRASWDKDKPPYEDTALTHIIKSSEGDFVQLFKYFGNALEWRLNPQAVPHILEDQSGTRKYYIGGSKAIDILNDYWHHMQYLGSEN